MLWEPVPDHLKEFNEEVVDVNNEFADEYSLQGKRRMRLPVISFLFRSFFLAYYPDLFCSRLPQLGIQRRNIYTPARWPSQFR